MKYIEAPKPYDMESKENKVFMAGGITGCPNWQWHMRALLTETNLTLLNPRRENFPIDDPSAAKAQICWEHHALRDADAIMFWFPKETLCPIALYELGAWSMTTKPIYVGIDPEYARRQDVKIQTKLVRPNIHIHPCLESLALEVEDYSKAPHLIKAVQVKLEGFGKCILKAEPSNIYERINSPADIIAGDIRTMIEEGTPGDELKITLVEMSKQDYAEMPEWTGW